MISNEDYVHGLPACVQEDGSGGPLPCYWDASVSGNGFGASYWVGQEVGDIHYTGELICGPGEWAKQDLTGCEPVPVNAQAPVLMTSTPPTYADVHELAHTGMDPAGAAAAVLMLVVGVSLVCLRGLGRRLMVKNRT